MKKILILATLLAGILAAGCSQAPAEEAAAPVDKTKDAETQKDPGAAPMKAND